MAEIEYTPNLALAKQPTGAREWGDVLNDNFDKIDSRAGDIQGSYNVGDIFYSMRTEQQFNGAALCDGASYSLEDFEGEATIGELLEAGKLPFVSLEEYESSLGSSGSCRAFGWDGGTEFRVPTIPALMLTKEQAAVVGNGMTLGFTNGTENFSAGCFYGSYGAQDTAFYGAQVGATGYTSNVQRIAGVGLTSDPEKSGIVANLNTIEYSAYVQLASKLRDISLQDYSSQLQETTDELNADIRLTGVETKNLIEESVERAEEISDKVVYGNIGDIKYTARTDTPAGGFWCDGATFDQQDLEQVYQMLVEGKLQSLPMAEYTSAVTENGSCGFFGLDTENKKFRVPLLTDVYLKAGQEAVDFGAESLPNITGSWTSQYNISQDNDSNCIGAISSTYSTDQGYYGGSGAGADWGFGFNFDASKSNEIYQDEAKVNPDHVKYRAYVILYLAEKELSIVNWTNELTRFTETLKEELLAYGTTTITYWE